jgi:hypothetical protein
MIRRVLSAPPLRPIYGWFTEGFDTPILREGKELLEQLCAPQNHTAGKEGRERRHRC